MTGSRRGGGAGAVAGGVAALFLLLLVALLLWTLAARGVFTPAPHQRGGTGQESGGHDGAGQPEAEGERTQDGGRRKEPLDISHIDGYVRNSDTEYVKPLKISPPPLHDHDIIYDQRYNKANGDQPNIRHHSGHFRHKLAEIWDPHPQYEIAAFGQKIHLILAHNDKVALPNLQITHVWSNFSRIVQPQVWASGCYYSGRVKDEEDSAVTVSLCGGMTGYIRSKEGNFYIEPVEKFQNFSVQSILHKIHRIKHLPHLNVNINRDYASNDDFSPEGQPEHRIVRRQAQRTRAKRPGNHEFFIEILVVADRRMSEYHKTDESLTHYILILMSHVALLYKDVTIGNPISMSVVRIMILKDMEFAQPHPEAGKSGVNAAEMLKKFCDYQKRVNVPEGDEHHHDVAILLTRENICRDIDKQQCDILGLAEVGTMCKSHSSCAIVEEKGLPTSYTIAHEMGHMFNMPHDDDNNCNRFHGDVKVNNIMNKMLQNDSKPWLWSPCSKHFITEFLDSNRVQCLLDAPKTDMVKNRNMSKRLPGESVSADKQCELVFGKGWRICSYMAPCGSLWCATEFGENEGCTTKFSPWADGTPCADRRWCHRGECVSVGRGALFNPVAGGWGHWQPWGQCTRSCGGGVKKSVRSCDSPRPENGGSYCTGRSVRYMSCNTEPCAADVPDFRDEQCAAFNGNTKGLPNLNADVKWVPKYGIHEDLCKLYCRVQHTTSYYLLSEKVADGTKCGLDSFDICVNGICRSGGCDNKLDSKQMLDECGICGGDNSKCAEISGKHNFTTPSFGYNKVIRIPKGSSNIDIQQSGENKTKDDNFLALVDSETGKYILNGYLMLATYRKVIIYGGVTIEYSGSEFGIERLNSSKSIQLKKDLIVELLSIGSLRSAEVQYSYKVVREAAPRYRWQLLHPSIADWTPCSAICSGIRRIKPSCVDITVSKVVPDENCADQHIDGARAQEECNTHCVLSWRLSWRGSCSARCGRGTRPLRHRCVKLDNTSEIPGVRALRHTPLHGSEGELELEPWAIEVNENHCAALPRPQSSEECDGGCGHVRWDYEPWTKCTKTCGAGLQVRNARCVDGHDNKVSEFLCDGLEKVTEQVCNMKNCPVWHFGEWTPCSASCGKGIRTKTHYCKLDNQVINIEYCDQTKLPPVQEDCFVKHCSRWRIGEWSKCSVSCGLGIQNREVLCETLEGTILDEAHCGDMVRPNSTNPCVREKCPFIQRKISYNDVDTNTIQTYVKYNWRSGPWSECSRSCSGGTKSRMVACQSEDGRQDEGRCDPTQRPKDTVLCNTQPCPKWNFGQWSECRSDCFQHRHVICQDPAGNPTSDNLCHPVMKPYTREPCCQENGTQSQASSMDRLPQVATSGAPQHSSRYRWRPGPWTTCSKDCNKTRSLSCVDTAMEATIVKHYCRHLKKPRTERRCYKNCGFTWHEGPWSECSRSCGEGIMRRNVTCHRVDAQGLSESPPAGKMPSFSRHRRRQHCDPHGKPAEVSTCLVRRCDDPYLWHPGPWSQCSHSCGKKGRQIRHLYCYHKDGKKVPKSWCSQTLKPIRKQTCNQRKCNFTSCKDVKEKLRTNQSKDYELIVNGKKLIVYCHSMHSNSPSEYISLPNEGRENYAEMYDKRLLNADTCPYGGQRNENCECMPAEASYSGLTIFYRIRLNITTLQIIGDDYTFSRQIKGDRIAYGSAGDCYSSAQQCPQGRFSIDLGGTGLRLAPETHWVTSGQSASISLNRQETKVSAKCGGYCGLCSPDYTIGLRVQIA